MFFSRALLRTDKADLAELSRLAAKDTYRAHQLVWDLFGDTPDRKRDYLYRRETVDGQPIFYIVSQRPPAPKTIFGMLCKKITPPRSKRANSLLSVSVLTRLFNAWVTRFWTSRANPSCGLQ